MGDIWKRITSDEMSVGGDLATKNHGSGWLGGSYKMTIGMC